MNIAIIGTGNIGSALARLLAGIKGNNVVVAGKSATDGAELAARLHADSGVNLESGSISRAVEQSDVVILAVPYGAIAGIARSVNFDGKILVDLSNPVKEDFSGITVGFSTSAAEEIQALLPGARVVKAFNTVFAQVYEQGLDFDGSAVPAFVASDSDAARSTVMELAARAGFDPVDAGPLSNARYLEPLGYLNIQFGYMLGHGTQIAPAWIRRKAA